MGENAEVIMNDTIAAIQTAARELAGRGMVSVSNAQMRTLELSGATPAELATIASLGGMLLSHKVRELADRMKVISALPEPEADGVVDWSKWTFDLRESHHYLRPARDWTDPLGRVLDRVCVRIADLVWQELPTPTYVAKRLLQEAQPVHATQLVAALAECYTLAGHIDPRLREAVINLSPDGDAVPPAGTLTSEAHPYPYPTPPPLPTSGPRWRKHWNRGNTSWTWEKSATSTTCARSCRTRPRPT